MNASSRRRLAWSASALLLSVLFVAGAPTIGQTFVASTGSQQPCPTGTTGNATTTTTRSTTTTAPFPPTLPTTSSSPPTTTPPTTTTVSCPPTNTTISTSFTLPPGGNTTSRSGTGNDTGGPEGEGGGIPGFTAPVFAVAAGLVVAAIGISRKKK
ncbi:MAG: hypothetical protein HYT80_01605 [Euryarchaeota archaeon]|nr:hypothetical protein [Euryarchaeota archaeon]